MYHQKPLLGQQIDWSHPLSKRLVACWVMNEGSGDRVSDLSGNNHNGMFGGSVSWGVQHIDFPGGNSDNVNFGTTDFNITNQMSIAMRLKWDHVDSNEMLFMKADEWGNANCHWVLRCNIAGRLTFGDLTNDAQKNTDAWTKSVWFDLVVTYDNGAVRFFNDAAELVLDDSTASLGSKSSAVARLGNGYAQLMGFTGDIEYVYLYNYALTPQKIQQLHINPYCMFQPVFDPALLVPMDIVTTVAPTTIPPTTLAPTTLAPTTLTPTTLAPTTVYPSTVAPTTLAPATTSVPTTMYPTTLAPTTLAPTTLAPTTLQPTTLAPTTLASTTVAPTTTAPTTLQPTTLAPTTVYPSTIPPTTFIPTTLWQSTAVPTTVAPTSLAPTTAVPTSLAPTTPAATTTAPTSLAPTTVAPTTLVPTTLAPTTLAPTTAYPTTLTPTTIGPTTLAPTTSVPTTTLTTAVPTTPGPEVICVKGLNSIISEELLMKSTIAKELMIHGNLC